MGSQGQDQGHKVVRAEIIRKYVTQGVGIAKMTTAPFTAHKLQEGLKVTSRRKD